MLRFKNYVKSLDIIDESFESPLFLSESMDSPAEFYMTDDTKMPRQIYAAFELDGTDYGMSLELSNFDRVYIMKFYRINNGKRRFWAFKKPAHIRRGLSTLLKFSEATLPFIKPRLDGIIVEIPGKYATQRFNRFVQLLLKKTYIKTFRYVPVVQEKTNSYNYIFFTKKTVNPKSLFKSKAFKNYNFEVDGALPVEAAQDIKEKKKPVASVTTKPSKKYQFKGYEVDNADIDDGLLDKVSKTHQDVVKAPEDKTKKDDPLPSFTDEELIYLINPTVFKTLNKSVGGFDPKKFNSGNLAYVIKQNLSNAGKDLLKKRGYWDGNNLSPKGIDRFKKAMKALSDKKDPLDVGNIQNKSVKLQASEKKSKQESGKILVSNINPNDLPIDTPGYSEFIDNITSIGYSFEKDEDIEEKEKHFYEKYCKANKELVTETDYNTVEKYTDHQYSDFNEPLRFATNRFFSGKSLTDLDKKALQTPKIVRLAKVFQKIKPIEENMWVYRGGYIRPEDRASFVPGSDYVDPAFLSTSLKSSNTFGLKNIKFAIYVPKGSRVLPALMDWSSHDNEKEIILPPMSIQKVIKTQVMDSDIIIAHTVFTGSAYDDIMSAMMSMNEEYTMTEAKKPTKKYDPDGKYGGQTTDPKVVEKIMKLLKSNKKIKK